MILGRIGAALCFTLFTGIATAQVSEPALNSNMPKAEAEATYYDAVKARQKGDDKQAEELLQRVIKLDPQASGAYYDMARIAVKRNNNERAIVNIKKAIEIDGENKWYRAQYAEILFNANKFEEAAEQYSELAKKEKFNDEYLLKSSFFYQRAGKYKESIAALDRLLVSDPNNEEIMLQQHQIYLKMNNLKGATEVIERLIKLNPADGRYYALLAETFDNNGDPKKANEVYKRAEQQFPDEPAIQLGMADHYRKNKDSVQYEVYLKKALNNKTLDADAQLALLVSYIQEVGDDELKLKEGLDLASRVADANSSNAAVIGVYADLLALNNQRDKAQEQYKRSLKIDPSRFAVWQNLLYNYTLPKDADSLILYSEKALKLFPNQATLHYLNGIGHSNKKDYKKALNALNRAIDMQPEENAALLADMYSTMGDVYNSNKQYTESDSAYEKALKLAPDNASVLNNYSYYLSMRNVRLKDAERMSKRSLELRPNEGTFLDTYGWILYMQGEYTKAKQYIQQAIDAAGKDSDGTLWEHFGDIHFKLNETDKAVEYWKKAKERGTDNAQIDKKIQTRKLHD